MANALEIGGAALQGIGSGLQQSMGNLRNTAMDIRNEPVFEAQKQQAITEGLQAQKMNQKYTKEQIVKQHPGGERYWSLAEQQGIIPPGSTEVRGFDVAKMSDFLSKNPNIVQSWITEDHAKAVNDAQRNDTAIATVTNDAKKIQEEISGLTAQNNPANDKKIESLTKKLQEKQGEAQTYAQAKDAAIKKQLSLSEQKDAIDKIVEHTFIQGLGKDDQFYAKIAQERKIPVTAENIAKIKSENAQNKETEVMGSSIYNQFPGIDPKKSYRVLRDNNGKITSVIGESARSGKASLSINNVTPEESKVLQKAVEEGRLDPNKINSRTGPILAKVLSGNKNLDLINASSVAAAIKKIETQRSTVESFEKTASKNFDMIEKMYDAMSRDKSIYILNKLRAKWDYDFSGDPELVPLARSMKTALTEYAKVITGQTGGAAVSDSARTEVETLLSVADRPETFKNSLTAHRQEMKNRMDSFQYTIDELRRGRGATVREEPKSDTGTIKGAHGEY